MSILATVQLKIAETANFGETKMRRAPLACDKVFISYRHFRTRCFFCRLEVTRNTFAYVCQEFSWPPKRFHGQVKVTHSWSRPWEHQRCRDLGRPGMQKWEPTQQAFFVLPNVIPTTGLPLSFHVKIVAEYTTISYINSYIYKRS